jgi:hypothetical protein
VAQTFQKLFFSSFEAFLLAKIAHFSLIFTFKAFCKKSATKITHFPPHKFLFLVAKSVLFVVGKARPIYLYGLSKSKPKNWIKNLKAI